MSKKDLPLLVDHFEFRANGPLIESTERKGKMIARGEFARANLATENKRMYPLSLWERETKKLAKKLSERKVLGELDHPMDGRTSLKRASHIITKLWMEGQVMMGEAEIMDTREGQDLKAMINAGASIGVSSRGFGTTRPNTEGVDVVQEDYSLMTFDFVSDPANVTSYPEVTMEDHKVSAPVAMEAVMDKIDLEKLRVSNPAAYESLMAEAEKEWDKKGAEIWAKKIMQAKESAGNDLRSSFAEQLDAALAEAKVEWEKELRNKLMNDPSVAGAKTTLESLKSILVPYVTPGDVQQVVTENTKVTNSLQEEINSLKESKAQLESEMTQLSAIAKEAGYRFHLEKVLSGNPQADLVRKIVGDVKLYDSVEAINAKIVEAVDEIKKVTVKQEERDHEIERLKQENAIFRQAAEKALEATKQMGLNNYIESRLLNHPRANEVRGLMESVGPSSKEEVDEVLSKFRERKTDPAAMEETRQRVRALVGSGTKEYLEEDNRSAGRVGGAGKNYNELGVDVKDIRALAGIGNENN